MSEPTRILIVDDEPTVRLALELAAGEQEGWHVESVESAEEALKSLEGGKYDMLLVDKNLPRMSGVELIRRVRETDERVGVVMITGYASAESAIQTLNLGIDGYIEKPFDDIYAVVEKLDGIVETRKGLKRSPTLANAFDHFKNAQAASQQATRMSDISDKRVLVASPVAEDREWFGAQLQNEVADFVSVGWSEDAVLHSRRQRPDLVIADMSLTQPDPVSMIKEILRFAPHVSFMVVADKNPPLKVITELIDLQVRVILDKPLDAKVFREKLDYVLMRVELAKLMLPEDQETAPT